MSTKIDRKRLNDLRAIHSALDDALGDTDINYMNDRELRETYPVQWAAAKLAKIIQQIR